MAARERIERYRREGGAADLTRVEVLVPAAGRDQIVRLAARLREAHRRNRRIEELCNEALSAYRTRVLDNLDLDRATDDRQRAALIARALMERGDARAFVLGRSILSELEA
jgi:hypothetical protein